jgi:hypothetical protein
MISLAILIIVYHFASTIAFCHMHAASDIQKYMMLHSKPTTQILVNNMINKYSKQSGVPSSYIKDCIESKKKVINTVKPKPNLRSNVKKGKP